TPSILALLRLQDGRDDQSDGSKHNAPDRATCSVHKDADHAKDDRARDDEFHVMFLFDEWFGKLAYSPAETPSASSVARSGATVGGSPFCSWNARSALRDPAPQTPSGVPASKPPAFSI